MDQRKREQRQQGQQGQQMINKKYLLIIIVTLIANSIVNGAIIKRESIDKDNNVTTTTTTTTTTTIATLPITSATPTIINSIEQQSINGDDNLKLNQTKSKIVENIELIKIRTTSPLTTKNNNNNNNNGSILIKTIRNNQAGQDDETKQGDETNIQQVFIEATTTDIPIAEQHFDISRYTSAYITPNNTDYNFNFENYQNDSNQNYYTSKTFHQDQFNKYRDDQHIQFIDNKSITITNTNPNNKDNNQLLNFTKSNYFSQNFDQLILTTPESIFFDEKHRQYENSNDKKNLNNNGDDSDSNSNSNLNFNNNQNSNDDDDDNKYQFISSSSSSLGASTNRKNLPNHSNDNNNNNNNNLLYNTTNENNSTIFFNNGNIENINYDLSTNEIKNITFHNGNDDDNKKNAKLSLADSSTTNETEPSTTNNNNNNITSEIWSLSNMENVEHTKNIIGEFYNTTINNNNDNGNGTFMVDKQELKLDEPIINKTEHLNDWIEITKHMVANNNSLIIMKNGTNKNRGESPKISDNTKKLGKSTMDDDDGDSTAEENQIVSISINTPFPMTTLLFSSTSSTTSPINPINPTNPPALSTSSSSSSSFNKENYSLHKNKDQQLDIIENKIDIIRINNNGGVGGNGGHNNDHAQQIHNNNGSNPNTNNNGDFIDFEFDTSKQNENQNYDVYSLSSDEKNFTDLLPIKLTNQNENKTLSSMTSSSPFLTTTISNDDDKNVLKIGNNTIENIKDLLSVTTESYIKKNFHTKIPNTDELSISANTSDAIAIATTINIMDVFSTMITTVDDDDDSITEIQTTTELNGIEIDDQYEEGNTTVDETIQTTELIPTSHTLMTIDLITNVPIVRKDDDNDIKVNKNPSSVINKTINIPSTDETNFNENNLEKFNNSQIPEFTTDYSNYIINIDNNKTTNEDDDGRDDMVKKQSQIIFDNTRKISTSSEIPFTTINKISDDNQLNNGTTTAGTSTTTTNYENNLIIVDNNIILNSTSEISTTSPSTIIINTTNSINSTTTEDSMTSSMTTTSSTSSSNPLNSSTTEMSPPPPPAPSPSSSSSTTATSTITDSNKIINTSSENNNKIIYDGDQDRDRDRDREDEEAEAEKQKLKKKENMNKIELSVTEINLSDKNFTEENEENFGMINKNEWMTSTINTATAAPLPIDVVDVENLSQPSLTSQQEDSGETMDVNAIIAISISVVGVCALILLVGFLYIMRKRQKQLTYGQRCRPVGLDAYSLDNVSVYNSVRRKGVLRTSKRSYGNAAFDDPALIRNPLNISQLAVFIRAEKVKSVIYDEFKDLPTVNARADEVPKGCEDKNRYANIIPLPETRVYLKRNGDDLKTEYINANYVKGPKDPTHYYIACQAPLDNTIIDFWRMIWEQNSIVIIMLTDLTENGIERCAEYLPPSFVIDNHVVFGDYQITLKNREVKDKYAVSQVHLKNLQTNTWREITHLWYQWPDDTNTVPTDETSIIAMLLEARSYLKILPNEQSDMMNDEMTDRDNKNGIDPDDAKTIIRNNSINKSDNSNNNNNNNNNDNIKDKDLIINNTNNTNNNNNNNNDKLKSVQKIQGPLTVHCSPGTGRTGTVIACDIAIRALEQPTRSVDIPQIVYFVRRGRASAVRTREQYEYIYKVAHMYATKLIGPSNMDN